MKLAITDNQVTHDTLKSLKIYDHIWHIDHINKLKGMRVPKDGSKMEIDCYDGAWSMEFENLIAVIKSVSSVEIF